MKKILSQFMRYLSAGFIAYAVDIGCFSALRYFLDFGIGGANSAARFAGALAAYGLNYYWTFSAHVYTTQSSLLKYASLWVLTTGISTSVMLAIASGVTHFAAEIVAKCVVEVFITVGNFLICKYWIYKRVVLP